MKKLKCKVCLKEWYVENSEVESLNVCPFCEVSIREKIMITEFDSLDKAIYSAIINKGIEILQYPQQLSGYLMDIAPKLKKEIRILSKTLDKEYMIYLKEIFEKEKTDNEIIIKKLKHLFIENEGLSENWADMICEALLEAIMYAKGIGMSSIVANVTDVEFLVEQQSQASIESESEIDTVKNKELTKEIVEKSKCVVCGYVVNRDTITDEKCPICNAKEWTKKFNKIEIKPYMTKRVLKKTIVCNDIAEKWHKKGNYKEAWEWYFKSAEAGDMIGQYFVAYYYQEGYHVQKNNQFALEYYKKSAEQGEPRALCALGVRYRNGIGVVKDEKKAADYFEKAAETEYAEAQWWLGMCYKEGIGREKDNTMAASCFFRAAKQKYIFAEDMLQKCIEDMPFSQRLFWKN